MARELDLTLAKVAHDKIYKQNGNVERARAYSAKVKRNKRNNAIITALMAVICIGTYAYIFLDAFNIPSLILASVK